MNASTVFPEVVMDAASGVAATLESDADDWLTMCGTKKRPTPWR